jgi:hypothetical protein
MAEENQKIQATQKEKSFPNDNPEKSSESKNKPPQQSNEVELDDEESEQDHRPRSYHSGGRSKQPRRVIEERPDDPYCE